MLYRGAEGFGEDVSLRSFLKDSSDGALWSWYGRVAEGGGLQPDDSVPKGMEAGARDRKQARGWGP